MKEKISITIEKDLLENIDKKSGLINRSVFIEDCLRKFFLKKKVNNLIIKPLRRKK